MSFSSRHGSFRHLFSISSRSTPALTFLRPLSTRSKLFQVSEEVRDAIETGKPVVALETTIYTHGFPYPANIALSSRLESLVRIHGGVPATIGIVNGVARVGTDPDHLLNLISTAGSPNTVKVSRRDLAYVLGSGISGKNLMGGTTISGTMILAHMAGIKIFATGGLGGVHRGGERSMDVSADLTELGRTPVSLICSGCKSFLDIPRTLEYLETQGVGVSSFADGRQGEVDFPAFFSRDSGVKSPRTIQSEADAAAIVHAQHVLGIGSGLIFANPVPEEAAMSSGEINGIIEQAVQEAEQKGISGHRNTPYILQRIRELSNGASVKANEALVESNVIRGTKVAVELAKLKKEEKEGMSNGKPHVVVSNLPTTKTQSNADTVSSETKPAIQLEASTAVKMNDVSSVTTPKESIQPPRKVDLLVIGSLAQDTSADYTPFTTPPDQIIPILKTSNPATISQSIGGVGRNVATAASYAGASVALVSAVANDLAGQSLLRQLEYDSVNSSHVQRFPSTEKVSTAQYIAFNDTAKDLVLAMGDFRIFDHSTFNSLSYWSQILSQTQSKYVVVDGNWNTAATSQILLACRKAGAKVAFEPVSTAKASRLFNSYASVIAAEKQINAASTIDNLVLPNHLLSLASPNKLELAAMHESASRNRLLESQKWWETIDSFGLPSSGSRSKLGYMTTPDLVDEGVPQQIIQLLPYIPGLIVKLGAQGVLLGMVLPKGDSRLSDPNCAEHILSRNDGDIGVAGGIYLRLFPTVETVPEAQIVSVNGVGDTLLGVVMAGLVRQTAGDKSARLEDVIPTAMRAAVMTLKSKDAVAGEVKLVAGMLSR